MVSEFKHPGLQAVYDYLLELHKQFAAQIDMAQKSDHSATIYIPVGNNGIPIVTTQPAAH